MYFILYLKYILCCVYYFIWNIYILLFKYFKVLKTNFILYIKIYYIVRYIHYILNILK
jgi:hypothetical protein